MKKLKVHLGIIGYLPFSIDENTILNYNSDFFEVTSVDKYHINQNSDTLNWGYSDALLNKELPKDHDADFFVGITYVPLEDNYYARRLDSNRVVLSYYEMHGIITDKNLPLENLIYRVLYGYGLVYLAANKAIPAKKQFVSFTHDDTRGCIFDMNGNKADVVFSLDNPVICDQCINNIRSYKVAENSITTVKNELPRIKKKRFFKMAEFVKRKPLLSIFISLVSGMVVGMIGRTLLELLFGDGTI